jgi:hypothetical protein
MGLTAHRDVYLVCGERGAEPHDLRVSVARFSQSAFYADFISALAFVQRRGGLLGLFGNVHVHLLGDVVAIIINNLVHFNLWSLLGQPL